MTKVDTDTWQIGFMGVTLFTVVIINIMVAIFQVSLNLFNVIKCLLLFDSFYILKVARIIKYFFNHYFHAGSCRDIPTLSKFKKVLLADSQTFNSFANLTTTFL